MNNGSALRKLPFSIGIPEPKRVASESSKHKAAREQEAHKLLDMLCVAVGEMYILTKREWLNKYWHNTLRHAEIALSYSGRSKRLKDTLETAVKDEIKKNMSDWANCDAAAAIHKIANFVVRTQQRSDALATLNMLYFKPHYKQNICELANTILCGEISPVVPLLNEFIAHKKWDASFEFAAALAYLFRLPGMTWKGQKPWLLVIHRMWEDVAAKVCAPFDSLDSLSDEGCITVAMEIHYRLKTCLEYGTSIVANMLGDENTSLPADEIRNFVQLALRPLTLNLQYFAQLLVLSSVRDVHSPEMILFCFLNELKCPIIPKEIFPELAKFVLIQICSRVNSVIARMALCSKVSVMIEMPCVTADKEYSRNVFLKEVSHSQDSKQFADLFRMVVSSSGDSLPPEVNQVIEMNNKIKNHDDGSLEVQLYKVVAEQILPQPIGKGLIPTAHQLDQFDVLTDYYYDNVRVMINEIQNPTKIDPISNSENVLILNSGYWMCSRDPFVSNNVSSELDQIAKPLKCGRKTFRYQQNWSTVDYEVDGSQFTCSWIQSQVVKKLLSSQVPLSCEQLLDDSDMAAVSLQDLSARSQGFVKQSVREGINYYAVDVSIRPQGNWTKLRFGDDYV